MQPIAPNPYNPKPINPIIPVNPSPYAPLPQQNRGYDVSGNPWVVILIAAGIFLLCSFTALIVYSSSASPARRPATSQHAPLTLVQRPADSPAPPGRMVAGKVTLGVSRAQLVPGQTAQVTIYNGLTTPIFVSNLHSNCTPLTLERAERDGSWRRMAGCWHDPIGTMMQIAPGTATVQRLTLGADWPDGTYRVTLAYGVEITGDDSESVVVHTAEFRVG